MHGVKIFLFFPGCGVRLVKTPEETEKESSAGAERDYVFGLGCLYLRFTSIEVKVNNYIPINSTLLNFLKSFALFAK